MNLRDSATKFIGVVQLVNYEWRMNTMKSLNLESNAPFVRSLELAMANAYFTVSLTFLSLNVRRRIEYDVLIWHEYNEFRRFVRRDDTKHDDRETCRTNRNDANFLSYSPSMMSIITSACFKTERVQ